MNIPYLDLSLSHKAQANKINEKMNQVIDSCQFILGEAVTSCEKKLGEFVGTPYAVTAASGTDALLMALMAAGIKAGDEVIVPSFSFFATAEVVVLLGAKPVFVDIEPDTYNVDVKKVAKAITSKTKAIMPVSLYGQVSDMNEILALGEKHNICIIEDAAQSFGAMYEGKRSCNVSRFGCTSFFPAKPLGCYGDGGAVFCQNEDDYKALVEIRTHGQSSRYHHTRLGINGRLDTIQCAIIEAKMERYPWEISQRQRVAETYNNAFAKLPGVSIPVVRKGRDSVWAQYTLAVDNRNEWTKALQELGVPTSVHYPKGLHQQPVMTQFAPAVELPVCETQCERVFSLPLYADIPDAHVEHVMKSVEKVAKTFA